MAPNTEKSDEPIYNRELEPLAPQAEPRKYTIVYSMVLVFLYWHIGALYGLYLAVTSVKWQTLLFNLLLYIAAACGITAGVHRLWSHRSYKAKLPLQVILMLFQTMACQQPVLKWVRDHRLHHKYVDTDADPHNATRGFFYSHIGWLMVEKHPDVIKKGKTIDMSDLLDNPVLQFQKKYYLPLMISLVFVMPTLVPFIFWRESLNSAYHVHLLALVLGSHITFSFNSVAHAIGNKPYDKNISPTQCIPLSVIAFGEGYHNYHHVFPFDYRVAELGNDCLNFSTNLIDFCAWIGWAYDRKYATEEMIAKRAQRTGDGTDLWGRVKGMDTMNQNTEVAEDVVNEVDVFSNNIWGDKNNDMIMLKAR